jgi:hypothetical protein
MKVKISGINEDKLYSEIMTHGALGSESKKVLDWILNEIQKGRRLNFVDVSGVNLDRFWKEVMSPRGSVGREMKKVYDAIVGYMQQASTFKFEETPQFVKDCLKAVKEGKHTKGDQDGMCWALYNKHAKGKPDVKFSKTEHLESTGSKARILEKLEKHGHSNPSKGIKNVEMQNTVLDPNVVDMIGTDIDTLIDIASNWENEVMYPIDDPKAEQKANEIRRELNNALRKVERGISPSAHMSKVQRINDSLASHNQKIFDKWKLILHLSFGAAKRRNQIQEYLKFIGIRF